MSNCENANCCYDKNKENNLSQEELEQIKNSIEQMPIHLELALFL